MSVAPFPVREAPSPLAVNVPLCLWRQLFDIMQEHLKSCVEYTPLLSRAALYYILSHHMVVERLSALAAGSRLGKRQG